MSGTGAGRTFEHITLGQRVLFGAGKAAEHLTGEIKRLGARKVMVIASARERPEAEKVTAGINVTLSYDDVAPHVPCTRPTRPETRRSGTASTCSSASAAAPPRASPKPSP